MDILINIENGDILSLMKAQRFQEALALSDTRCSGEIPFDRLMHLYLLKAYCNYSLEQYPLAVNTLGKILKHRYSNQIEHHILSQAFYLLAQTHMKHSKGRNKAKNRSTFTAISNCFDLLCYQEETLELMDKFLDLVGEAGKAE